MKGKAPLLNLKFEHTHTYIESQIKSRTALKNLIEKTCNNWRSQEHITLLKQVTLYVTQQNNLQNISLCFSQDSTQVDINLFLALINTCYQQINELFSAQKKYEEKIKDTTISNNKLWDDFIKDNQQEILLLNKEDLEIFQEFLDLRKHNDDNWQQLIKSNYQTFRDLLHNLNIRWQIILTQESRINQISMINDLKTHNSKILQDLTSYNNATLDNRKELNTTNLHNFLRRSNNTELTNLVKLFLEDMHINRRDQLHTLYNQELDQWQELERYNDTQFEQLKCQDSDCGLQWKEWSIFFNNNIDQKVKNNYLLCIYKNWYQNNPIQQTLLPKTFSAIQSYVIQQKIKHSKEYLTWNILDQQVNLNLQPSVQVGTPLPSVQVADRQINVSITHQLSVSVIKKKQSLRQDQVEPTARPTYKAASIAVSRQEMQDNQPSR
jgi:hypothetical protein